MDGGGDKGDGIYCKGKNIVELDCKEQRRLREEEAKQRLREKEEDKYNAFRERLNEEIDRQHDEEDDEDFEANGQCWWLIIGGGKGKGGGMCGGKGKGDEEAATQVRHRLENGKGKCKGKGKGKGKDAVRHRLENGKLSCAIAYSAWWHDKWHDDMGHAFAKREQMHFDMTNDINYDMMTWHVAMPGLFTLALMHLAH